MGPHKKRHGNIFCRSQLLREKFRRLQGRLLAGHLPPVYQKDPGEPRGWPRMDGDDVARQPPRNFEPAIIVVVIADCSLFVMRNVRAVFERTKWQSSTAGWRQSKDEIRQYNDVNFNRARYLRIPRT